MSAPRDLTAALEALDSGEVTASQLVEEALARIEAEDDEIGAFLALDAEGARAKAKESDARRAAGEAIGKLEGIPFTLKDNIVTRGLPTTAASKMLKSYRSPFDATIASKLDAEGAILLGKVNLDEFAMGSSTERSAAHPTRNPWDRTRVPGGSSGGSAAAVAAGFGYFSIGSDTGGSLRQPASFCGINTLKPTVGLFSRYGLIPLAPSLDQPGPLTRSARDLALITEALRGYDPLDSWSSKRELAPARELRGLKVGVLRPALERVEHEAIRRGHDAVVETLRVQGCEIVDVEIPHANFALPAYHAIVSAESSSGMARYDGVRYGARVSKDELYEMMDATRGANFGVEVKRRILFGAYLLMEENVERFVQRARRVRTLILRDFEAAFEKVDLIVTPSTATPAFELGSRGDDPLAMYLSDYFTLPASLAGFPALSTPMGLDESGLPLGIQLIGAPFEEATLFEVAKAVEAEHGVLDRLPAINGVNE